MPVLQGGRWQRFAQKLFGIQGEVVASELAPEIYCVADVTKLALEEMIIGSWRPAIMTASQAATAAETDYVALQNPVGSGSILVVQRCLAFSLTTGLIVNFPLGYAIAPIAGSATPVKGIIRDTRIGKGSALNSTGQVVAGHAAAIPTVAVVGSIPVSFTNANGEVAVMVDSELDGWVVNPGESLVVLAPTVNVQVTATFWWRERALESSETSA